MFSSISRSIVNRFLYLQYNKSCLNISKKCVKLDLYAVLQNLDHLTCSKLKIWTHYTNSGILLHVKWCNFWNNEYNFTKFLPILGHDLKMSCAKFQRNRFGIDWEIDEQHALQIIVSYSIGVVCNLPLLSGLTKHTLKTPSTSLDYSQKKQKRPVSLRCHNPRSAIYIVRVVAITVLVSSFLFI